jgi:hypothetical protein
MRLIIKIDGVAVIEAVDQFRVDVAFDAVTIDLTRDSVKELIFQLEDLLEAL